MDFSQLFGQGGGAGGIGGIEEICCGSSPAAAAAGRAAAVRTRGMDLQHELQVPFTTSITGGQAQLSVRRSDGHVETLTVKIPAGIEDGQTIRLRSQGVPSSAGGPPGDLLIKVHVAKHPYFHRQGNDLEVAVPVTLAEAARGAKVDIPTPKGIITLKVPPGTSSGKRLRLKGMGVASQSGLGDLYAEIQIALPETLDDDALELIRQLDRLHPHDPRTDLRW